MKRFTSSKPFIFALLLLPFAACARVSPDAPSALAPPAAPKNGLQSKSAHTRQSDQVVVIANRNSPDSLTIADYYLLKRRIPRANLCLLACPATEDCDQADFDRQIAAPVSAFLKNKNAVTYLVLTKGVPLRVRQDGACVDSLLALPPEAQKGRHLLNPYFQKQEPFDRAKFGYYLAVRLDGYTRADCLALVNRSLAARPLPGPFLLHTGPGHEEASYTGVNDGIRTGAAQLQRKRLNVVLDTGETFPGGYKNLMGYFSWGSNDARWNKKAYNSLTFAPGSIAETVVSTSGRTFADPNARGQSLIADLVAQGVTGCKGYVSEPYADAIARADVLFDRYTSGYNLAESFYAASRYLGWKDVVIGDPLCSPYARKREPAK